MRTSGWQLRSAPAPHQTALPSASPLSKEHVPFPLCSADGGVCLFSTPAHQVIQDYTEDAHLSLIYLRARSCLSCQPTQLPRVYSQPGFLHQLLTAPLCSKPTLSPCGQGSVLAALPEWHPGVAAFFGRTRAGVSPVLPQDCWAVIFVSGTEGWLSSAVPEQHQAVGSDLSLCGESRRESTESRYCVMGLRESSMQKVAPRRARASTHAGLLHLLVPTEDSIIPDWESEVRLSVRSKLQVWLSCLWTKPQMGSEQGIPPQCLLQRAACRHSSHSALHWHPLSLSH